MMSTRDFEHKQIAFVFTTDGEKISFKNDNLIVTDKDGKIKHQSTCYRLFALFICGDFCLTSGVLERSKKFGFTIVFMSPNLRITSIMPSKAEGNVLLRKKQYSYDKTEIASHVIANKIHNQTFLLKKKRKKTEEEKEVIAKLEQYEKDVLQPNLSVQEIMGIEGISAKLYSKTLFAEYNWQARLPRVKNDITNTLMDIGYTILFNIVNALLEMYGFDVYVGILHTQFFHRKSLVCDLEEPFRPIVDAAILKALNLGQINEKDFWKNQNQYILPWKNSKKYVGIILEALLEYKNEIFIYLQSYYRAFMRDKPIEEFPMFEMEEI
ncbi:MAG: type V CRISPR-associated endonuclease Cas1 [Spirochaetaceae bacterium]|nr:type V CRISPR-associated endonuclease Cas1 [Spirochaetaceae bacterium]